MSKNPQDEVSKGKEEKKESRKRKRLLGCGYLLCQSSYFRNTNLFFKLTTFKYHI